MHDRSDATDMGKDPFSDIHLGDRNLKLGEKPYPYTS
jgi:hypothetical protein